MLIDTNNNNDASLKLVLGYLAVKDLEDVKEQVEVLSRLDFTNKEISKICGLKEPSIRSIKSRVKKS